MAISSISLPLWQGDYRRAAVGKPKAIHPWTGWLAYSASRSERRTTFSADCSWLWGWSWPCGRIAFVTRRQVHLTTARGPTRSQHRCRVSVLTRQLRSDLKPGKKCRFVITPCPCGYYGDHEREVQANCVRRLAGHGCAAGAALAPLCEKRISGPLMDRFDSLAGGSARGCF